MDKCNVCKEHKACIVYYVEVNNRPSYQPFFEGKAICYKCDLRLSKNLLKKVGLGIDVTLGDKVVARIEHGNKISLIELNKFMKEINERAKQRKFR